MTRTANIIGWDNGGGLSRDIDVLSAALRQAGWLVAFNGRRTRSLSRTKFAKTLDRVRCKVIRIAVPAGLAEPPFDLNLHLEDIQGQCLALAARNVLIPNQEWYREWSAPYLPRIDEVWVKTRMAGRVFEGLGCTVRFIGWESMDRQATIVRPKALAGLHIAGASIAKGTEVLLDVWSEHPQWPMLRVLRRMSGYSREVLPWRDRPPSANIEIISERVAEQTLIQWQNESAIHLCPSEAEGFGHNILEAMSVGAVIITTDAPPMNEIITRSTGLLVPAERSEPMGLGRRYFVNARELAQGIQSALGMTDEERAALGRAARARFEETRVAFRGRLRHYLDLVSGAANEGLPVRRRA